jgi:hypothetical protein
MLDFIPKPNNLHCKLCRVDFIRGSEIQVVVHITDSVTGSHIEAIYPRCKSKLIIVCNEDAVVSLQSNAQKIEVFGN